MLSFFGFFFSVCFLFWFCLERGRLEEPPCLCSVCESTMSFPSIREKKKESDGGKMGEENLLGMGFCSVENCQLGFLL